MSYALRGSVFSMVLIAGIGACSVMDQAANYQPAKASVVMIDRTCDIIETRTGDDGRSVSSTTKGSCISVDEWQTVKEKRTKDVSGKAVVHVSYVAPQDGSPQTSTLEFNGRDDEFYELKAGDEIDVLVRNDDPSEIRRG